MSIQYVSPIKGKPKKKIVAPAIQAGVNDVVKVVSDLNDLKDTLIETGNDVINQANEKLSELDSAVSKAEDTLATATQTLLDTQEEVIRHTAEIKKGDQGEPGENADEEAIYNRLLPKIPVALDVVKLEKTILSKVPKFDEKGLLKKFLSAVPVTQTKSDLKIIKESISLDPMIVVEQILSLPVEKFQLGIGNIKGLEQTIASLRSQFANSSGKLGGGGFSNIYNAGTLVSNGLTGLNFAGTAISSVSKDASTGIITVTINGGGASPLTTKGDIYGFSTVGARIPVGADGTVLTADSTQVLGVKWAAVSGTGTVTSVASADGSITVTNPTTAVDLAVVKAPKWSTARTLAGNSVDGSTNVAFANKFIVQGTTDAGLSAAQFLGALGTGIVKNTTTTGVLSIAIASDFPTLNQSTTGSAATLTTGRTISITGDLTYTSPSFDGSGNVTAAGTLATVNGNVGSFTNATITVNAKGLITAASSGTAPVTSISITSQDGVSGTSSGGATPALTLQTAATTITVAQTAHGFVVGNVIKSSGTADQYAKAQADSAANAEVVGVVSRVIDANNFVYTTEGIITSGVPTNTAGTVYFLDPAVAGGLTATKPTTSGQVVKPVLTVLNSATRAVVSYSFLGTLLSAASVTPYSPTIGGTGVANNAANTITFSGNFGLTLTLSAGTSVTLPTSGTLATLAGSEVFTNKTMIATSNVVEEITTTASSATPTPTGGSLRNFFTVTALAAAAAFAAPSGSPVNGNYLTIRIKDNATARALTWNAIYRASTSLALPTTTTISKTMYLGFRYNGADSTWDFLSLNDGF